MVLYADLAFKYLWLKQYHSNPYLCKSMAHNIFLLVDYLNFVRHNTGMLLI